MHDGFAMTNMHRISRWIVAVVLLGIALALLSGCGEDEQRKASRPRPREHSSQVAALNARLSRLEERLEQLDREMETQRNLQHNQIAAAQEDLNTVRETLGAYNKQLARSARTSESLLLLRESREDQENARVSRERAENRVLTTLLLLVFIVFLAVFGAKVWRDWANEDDEGQGPHPPGASPADDSYVFYSKGESAAQPKSEKPKEGDTPPDAPTA
jgi:outer membrane murein-binding lipoprotein Lpp